MRQCETAAIKAQSENRNKPFERKLDGIYTRATLEAGEMVLGTGTSGVLGEEGGVAAQQPEVCALCVCWN